MATMSANIPCNLCGVDKPVTLFEAGVAQISRIVSCSACGLMYASPRSKPVDQDVVKAFDPEMTRDASLYDPTRYEKERLQVRDYADTRAELAKLYPGRGKLLEIGCGMGFQLEAFAKDGWQVTGIEPDRGFCQFIQSELRLDALPTILEEADLPDDSFDVVVILHVIEHVPDPVGTLREIYRVLKPGGRVVIETPRYDSLMFRLLRHRERSINCDGHIYFYTTDTLRKSCEVAGFECERVRYVGRSLNLSRLAWNLGVMSKSNAVKAGLRTVSRTLGLESLNVRVNMRDMQRITVRKPGAA